MNQEMVNTYYKLKPYIPRLLQVVIRSQFIRLKRRRYNNTWPIDREAGNVPENWQGWPGNKRFALILSHDVDTLMGQEKCERLAEIEQRLGFRSSFNFVITNRVSCGLRNFLDKQGFEIGVHGLWHDRSLYESREKFDYQAGIINGYLKEWRAVGFRSPAMHHNLEWLHGLDISYDASTFDTDPFEPQPDGMRTIFPFYVDGGRHGNGYVELPYTLPQDFTLFVLMGEKDTAIWNEKLEWICEKGGMALLNVHPDYMDFTGGKTAHGEYPADFYADFLANVKTRYEGQFWHVLPREMAHFWHLSFGAGRKLP